MRKYLLGLSSFIESLRLSSPKDDTQKELIYGEIVLQ